MKPPKSSCAEESSLSLFLIPLLMIRLRINNPTSCLLGSMQSSARRGSAAQPNTLLTESAAVINAPAGKRERERETLPELLVLLSEMTQGYPKHLLLMYFSYFPYFSCVMLGQTTLKWGFLDFTESAQHNRATVGLWDAHIRVHASQARRPTLNPPLPLKSDQSGPPVPVWLMWEIVEYSFQLKSKLRSTLLLG